MLLVNGMTKPKIVMHAGVWEKFRFIYAGWEEDALYISVGNGDACEVNLL